jgi:L-ascorbate metabolism protein UlaG (beta-lactamase superfamily)
MEAHRGSSGSEQRDGPEITAEFKRAQRDRMSAFIGEALGEAAPLSQRERARVNAALDAIRGHDAPAIVHVHRGHVGSAVAAAIVSLRAVRRIVSAEPNRIALDWPRFESIFD